MQVNERIGLLGGTFDPVHNGHLQIAETALTALSLDRILFIPAAVPPHKPDRVITPFSTRVDMLQLALKGRQQMELTGIEESLPKPSYTIDTIRELQRLNGDTDYFYCIGLDAFLEIDTWKSYHSLLSSIHFIVVLRSGYLSSSIDSFLQQLGYQRDQESWINSRSSKRIYFIAKEITDVSSSLIRDYIKKNRSIRELLPESVADFIKKRRLYR